MLQDFDQKILLQDEYIKNNFVYIFVGIYYKTIYWSVYETEFSFSHSQDGAALLVCDFVATMWVWPASPVIVNRPPGTPALLGLVVRPKMICLKHRHQLGNRSWGRNQNRNWILSRSWRWNLYRNWSWDLLGLFGLLRRLSLGWSRLGWFQDHDGLNRTASFVAKFVHKLLRIVTNHLDGDCVSLLIVHFVSYFLFCFCKSTKRSYYSPSFMPFTTAIIQRSREKLTRELAESFLGLSFAFGTC